jgi:hypothetical protein
MGSSALGGLPVAPFALLIIVAEIALAVFLLSFANRLVKAVEGIDRSIARAVARYERSAP